MNVKSEEPTFYKTAETPTVIFSHGKESGPFGEKMLALARVASSYGLEVAHPDFQRMKNAEERVKHLLELASSMSGKFILVGSSMGSYVSLRASRTLPTKGLFLMAPAVGLPGYRVPRPRPGCKMMTIIHAWQDKTIPVNSIIEYAEYHKAELHLVNSDHRLSKQIPLLEKLFDEFLGKL